MPSRFDIVKNGVILTENQRGNSSVPKSFEQKLFYNHVLPRPGSILKIDLGSNLVGSLCHLGIYAGSNLIVESIQADGSGMIRTVSPKAFFEYSLWPDGVFIYAACGKTDGKYYPLADPEIAKRALKAAGNPDFFLLPDDGHQFAEYCITGEYDSLTGTLENVEASLAEHFQLSGPGHAPGSISASPVYWVSTGVTMNDFFPD